MDTQPPKRLTLEDCKIDWKNYPIEDENGNPTTADFTEKREELLIWDCECNEDCLANKEICYLYYTFDYDIEKFNQWMRQERLTKSNIAYWGLIRMFNDGWIKSPTFVDWRDVFLFFNNDIIKRFVEAILKLDTRIDILKHFIHNAEFLVGKNRKKELLPGLKNLLSIQQEALKLHKEELKQKAAAEKAKNKTPKEKPEYILTLDEIINYVREENPDSAHVIRGMLRFFAMEKSGWSTAAVKKRIEQINQQTLVQQTNYNAPVGQAVQEQHVNNLTTK
jgi:hypothetical protein